MIKIDVLIKEKKWKKYINNPQNYLKNKINKIKSLIPIIKNKKVVFSVLLTGNNQIKNLNKKFRNKNKTTDVLSFPFLSFNYLALKKEKYLYIGDLATSYEIINTRAKKNNFLMEFDKVWVHGLLHLIGYNHIKNKDYFKMYKVEKKIIDSFN